MLCDLPGFTRLDSLAVTEAGNICVATLVTGEITTIAPDGRILGRVKYPDPMVTNIAFGGADMQDAAVTLSSTGKLALARWDEPGLRLNYNA